MKNQELKDEVEKLKKRNRKGHYDRQFSKDNILIKN